MTENNDDLESEGAEDTQTVELTKQPIELYKILKFEGLVGSGGEAKAAIAAGHVSLNGVVETQKRKKIVSGDIIEFAGSRYRLHCDAEIEPVASGGTQDEKPGTTEKAKLSRKRTARPVRKKQATKKAGRKAIGIKS